jgi:hypothetical protein
MAKRTEAYRAPEYKARPDLKGIEKFPGGKAPIARPIERAKARISGGRGLADAVTGSLRSRLPGYRSASETLAKRGLDRADIDAERRIRHGSSRIGGHKSTSHADALTDAMRESADRRTTSGTSILKSEIAREKGISDTSAGLKDLAARGKLTGESRGMPKLGTMESAMSSVLGKKPKSPGGAFGYTPWGRTKDFVKKSRVSVF